MNTQARRRARIVTLRNALHNMTGEDLIVWATTYLDDVKRITDVFTDVETLNDKRMEAEGTVQETVLDFVDVVDCAKNPVAGSDTSSSCVTLPEKQTRKEQEVKTQGFSSKGKGRG